MSEDVKVYHVETQEDYDDLMIELEEQGYKWLSGDNPTTQYWWHENEKQTVIYLNEGGYRAITRGFIRSAKTHYPNINIIKHKAKGVKQMGKVVVPQFVADWFEKNKNGVTVYGLLHLFSDNYFIYDGFRKWVKDYDINEAEAQDIIAKMYLFQDYEVEEKKYYWRKKKEYLCVFEEQGDLYLNVNKETGKLSFESKTEIGIIQTSLTKTEVKRIVSEEDFNKLERVEIDE